MIQGGLRYLFSWGSREGWYLLSLLRGLLPYGGLIETFPVEGIGFILPAVIVMGTIFGGILGGVWKFKRSSQVNGLGIRHSKTLKSEDFLPLKPESIKRTEKGFCVGKRLFVRLQDAEEYLYHVDVQREPTGKDYVRRRMMAVVYFVIPCIALILSFFSLLILGAKGVVGVHMIFSAAPLVMLTRNLCRELPRFLWLWRLGAAGPPLSLAIYLFADRPSEIEFWSGYLVSALIVSLGCTLGSQMRASEDQDAT